MQWHAWYDPNISATAENQCCICVCTLCCFMKQALTAVDVQRHAAEQVAESGDAVYRSTRLLAGLGGSGTLPGNMERDLHRLLCRECPLPVVPRCRSKRSDVLLLNLPILLVWPVSCTIF